MLKIRISNIEEWKAILEAISDIVEDAMFICGDDGISFRGMDPAHVALLDVEIPKSSFDEYHFEASFFGLKINDFKDFFNAANIGDIVDLKIVNEGLLNMHVSSSIEMQYTIKLLDRKWVNVPIPKMKMMAQFKIAIGTINRVISSLEKISEHVTVTSKPNKVLFFNKGDIGDGNVELSSLNDELKELNLKEDCSCKYSLEYMSKIVHSIGRACKDVKIEYGNDNPLHMVFHLPSKTKVNYYLAPSVID